MTHHRHLVITGASGRLGQRMARAFQNDAFRVTGIGRGSDYEADLSQEDQVVQVFGAIAAERGPLYGLIHTVGTWRSQAVADTSLLDWHQMMTINLTTTFLCFREAARQMTLGEGRLLAVASAQGADQGRACQAAYAASKAGVVRLVESVAGEYESQGITAHCLAPSVITYGEPGATGVSARDLVAAARYLCGRSGAAANGTILRLYG